MNKPLTLAATILTGLCSAVCPTAAQTWIQASAPYLT
jgi:hypothetical protein